MVRLKLISNYCGRVESGMSLFQLPDEQLEHLLRYCSLKSLLNLRLTNSRVLRNTALGVANRFNVSWQYCLRSRLSPFELAHHYPFQYLNNLTVSLTLSPFASRVMNALNVELDSVQSFVQYNSDVSIPMSTRICNIGESFSGILNDGCPIVWKKGEQGYECLIYPKQEGVTSFYRENKEFLLFVPQNDQAWIGVSKLALSDDTVKLIAGRKIHKCYKSLPPTMLLAKLEDGNFVCLTNWLKSFPEIPRISTERTVKDIAYTYSGLLLILLDNGDISCLDINKSRKDVEKSGFKKIKDYLKNKKVSILDYNGTLYTLVLEDLRTVIQLYYSSQEEEYMIKSFLFRERSDIKAIYSNEEAFIALFANEKIAVWGNEYLGGEMPKLPKGYSIRAIHHTAGAFLAILNDGTIIPWGDELFGGVLHEMPKDRAVKAVFSTSSSFLLVLDDNTLLCLGCLTGGGVLPEELKGVPVRATFSNNFAFLVILEDGRLCYWGSKALSGRILSLPRGRSVLEVIPTMHSFVLRLDNDSLVPIGMPNSSFSRHDDFSLLSMKMPEGRKLAVINDV